MLLELSVDAVFGEVLCVGFLGCAGDYTVFGELSVNVLMSRDLLEFKFILISIGGLERYANNSCLSSLIEVWIDLSDSVLDVWIIFSTDSLSCAAFASDLFLSSSRLLLVCSFKIEIASLDFVSV